MEALLRPGVPKLAPRRSQHRSRSQLVAGVRSLGVGAHVHAGTSMGRQRDLVTFTGANIWGMQIPYIEVCIGAHVWGM